MASVSRAYLGTLGRSRSSSALLAFLLIDDEGGTFFKDRLVRTDVQTGSAAAAEIGVDAVGHRESPFSILFRTPLSCCDAGFAVRGGRSDESAVLMPITSVSCTLKTSLISLLLRPCPWRAERATFGTAQIPMRQMEQRLCQGHMPRHRQATHVAVVSTNSKVLATGASGSGTAPGPFDEPAHAAFRHRRFGTSLYGFASDQHITDSVLPSAGGIRSIVLEIRGLCATLRHAVVHRQPGVQRPARPVEATRSAVSAGARPCRIPPRDRPRDRAAPLAPASDRRRQSPRSDRGGGRRYPSAGGCAR